MVAVAAEFDPLFRSICRGLQGEMAGPSLQVGTIVELTTRALDEAVDAAMLFLPDGKLRQNALITVEDPLYPRDVPLQALRVKIDRRLGLWLLGQADSSAPAWLERVLPRRVLAAGAAARGAQGGPGGAPRRRARGRAAHAGRAAGPARRRQEVRGRGAVRRARPGALRRRLPRHAARARTGPGPSTASSCPRAWPRCGARRSSSAPRPTSIITTRSSSSTTGGLARGPRRRVARGAGVGDVQDAAGADRVRRRAAAGLLRHRGALRGAGRGGAGGARARALSLAGAARGHLAADLRAPARRRRRQRRRLDRDRPQARARRRAHPVGRALGGVGGDACARTAFRRW